MVRQLRKAAIDVGSNSVLLLVEEKQEGVWRTVYEGSEVTSLGEGTKKTGLLSKLGMERTLKALARFYREAHEQGAEEVVCAATMAARIATNTGEFQSLAAEQNTPVFVLSGDDEAQLGFLCVATDPTFQDYERISIVDVGGQSTEIVTAENVADEWQVLFRRSIAIGTLALKGSSLSKECPDPADILNAVVEIDEQIGLCYLKNKCGAAVCLGATGTNLAAIRDKVDPWNPDLVQGAWLGFGEISQEAGRLMQMTERERASLIGMEPGREATLPAGALILERVLNAIGAGGSFVSTRGWRHALIETGLPKPAL